MNQQGTISESMEAAHERGEEETVTWEEMAANCENKKMGEGMIKAMGFVKAHPELWMSEEDYKQHLKEKKEEDDRP